MLAAPAAAGAADGDFRLTQAKVEPQHAFFDARAKPQLEFRFRGGEAADIVIRVVRRDGGAVRRWVEPDAAPGRLLTRRWNGRRGDGAPARSGRYRFEVGPVGGTLRSAGSFRFFDHRFPVAGPHSYGDRFGAPRSGGRVHEGQDLVAGCGIRLIAARGGRVQSRGYSASLFGHWILIDARATRADHFYAHLRGPSPLSKHDRVRTGKRIGSVGKSGNARTEFCQLHFELWPRGYRHGSPTDPLRSLRRWDRRS